MKTLRIFISSPGDVAEEREKAKQVVTALQRELNDQAELVPVLWEDLAIPATASFQEGIDYVLSEKHRIDIAVFILWSRLGSPLGNAITKPDGTAYRSGTEREFDLMLAAYGQSGRKMPLILAYTRDDLGAFSDKLDARTQQDDALEELIRQRKLVKQFIQERFHDEQGRNLRAYHTYREPVGFAQRLMVHLREAVNDILGLELSAARWSGSPYRSLEVFDIMHAPIFFGRDEETCELLQRLRDQQSAGCAFVCIVGASGSGKSSLARAGVAATLKQRSFDDGVKEWRAAVFLPSLAAGDLFLGLARTLADQLPELRTGPGGIEDFAKCLEDQNFKAASILLAAAFNGKQNKENGTRLLLVLDQMEELWTDRSVTPEQREKFLQAIEALARSGLISVLGTLRSDFYPQAQLSEAFLRMKGERGHFDLTPPGTAALQQLIVQPAHRAGLRFQRDDRTGRPLDQRILEDAARDPSALPLLQYALAELYERRDENQHLLTYAAYEAMGGVEGALGQRAAQTFESLPNDAQVALDEMLPLLISVDIVGEQNAVRRRAPLADLTSTPSRRQLTEALIASRFLTTDEQGGKPVATLAHEALLRRWERITIWINTNRDLLRMRARVEQYQAMWEQSGKDDSRLLPTGLPLEEGRRLTDATPQVLDANTQRFILASFAHHEEQQRRALRRRRLAFATLSALTVLALVTCAIAWRMKVRAESQKRALNRAMEENVTLMWNGSYASQDVAKRTFENGNYCLGVAHLISALSQRPVNNSALNASIYFSVGPSAPKWIPLVCSAHTRVIDALEISPAGDSYAVGSRTHAPEIMPWVYGKKVVELSGKSSARSLAYNPDGQKIATGCADGRMRLYETATGKMLLEIVCGKKSMPVAYSHDGHWIASGCNVPNGVIVLDATTGHVKSRISCNAPVTALKYSPDDHSLAIGCWTDGRDNEQALTILEIDSGQRVSDLVKSRYVNSLSFSPDGLLIAVGTHDGLLLLLNAVTAEIVGQLKCEDSVRAVIFSPDGRYLAAGSLDGTVHIIDLTAVTTLSESKDKELLRLQSTMHQFGSPVRALSFGPTGNNLAVATADGLVRSLEPWTPDRLGFSDFDDNTRPVAFTLDGNEMLIAGRKWVGMLNLLQNKYTFKIPIEPEVQTAALSPDGCKIAVGSGEPTASVSIRRATTGEAIGNPIPVGEKVERICFSPDSKLIAVQMLHETLILEAETGDLTQNISTSGHSITFSADGKWLLQNTLWRRMDEKCEMSSGRAWEVLSGKEMENVWKDVPSGEAIACSLNSRWMAIADGLENNVHLFEAKTGILKSRLEVQDTVHLLTFDSENKRLACGSDRFLVVFNTDTSQSIFHIKFDAYLKAISFSPRNHCLAVGLSDLTVRILDTHSGRELARLPSPYSLDSIAFSPKGDYMHALPTRSGAVRSFDMSWLSPSDEKASKAWIAALQIMSGFKLTDGGYPRPILPDELKSDCLTISATLASDISTNEALQNKVLRWLFKDSDRRASKPWHTRAIWRNVGAELIDPDSSRGERIKAIDQAPWHPLEPVSLACIETWYWLALDDSTHETQMIRSRFLARLTLKRLRDADEKLYGRDTLAEYAAWAAKIMHEELHLDPEALEAIGFALERTPPEKQKDLLEFRSKISQPK